MNLEQEKGRVEEVIRLTKLDRDFTYLKDNCEFVMNRLLEGSGSEYTRITLGTLLKLVLREVELPEGEIQ